MARRPNRFYKISKSTVKKASGDTYSMFSIRVPKHIGDLLDERNLEFEPVLTDDGLLFRPVPQAEVEEQEDITLPEWAQA